MSAQFPARYNSITKRRSFSAGGIDLPTHVLAAMDRSGFSHFTVFQDSLEA
jgi:hypothetical protein